MYNLLYCVVQYGILGWQVSVVKTRQWEYENRMLPATGFTDGFQARFPGLYALYTETPERRRVNAMFAIVLICLFLCIIHLMTTSLMLYGAFARRPGAILPFFFTGIPTVVMCTAYAVLWWSGDIFNEQLTMSVAEFVMSLAINGVCMVIVMFYYYRLTGQLSSNKPRRMPPTHFNTQDYPNEQHRTSYPDGHVPPWRTEWSNTPPYQLEKKLRRREQYGTPVRPILEDLRRSKRARSMEDLAKRSGQNTSAETIQSLPLVPPTSKYHPQNLRGDSRNTFSIISPETTSPLVIYKEPEPEKLPEQSDFDDRSKRRSRRRRRSSTRRSKSCDKCHHSHHHHHHHHDSSFRRKSPQRVSFNSKTKVYERTPESSISGRPDKVTVV
uniref:Conserved plasma membrane protein n=1 Tax=Panagrellus redivivus TaxID=6233 RepID=A0A7E4UNS6_PANRE